MLATLPDPGGYVSLVKVFFMLVLTVPWLMVAPWIHKDVFRVHGSQAKWGSVVLLAGVLGICIWLLVPFYFVGMAVYVVLTGAAAIAYVTWRDGRVDPVQRILTAQVLGAVFQRRAGKEEILTRVKIYDRDGTIVRPPDPETASVQDCHTYNVVQEFLANVLMRRASEADVTPKGRQSAVVRFVVDGMLYDQPPLELAEADALIQFLKAPAGMDLPERRRPQEGHVSVDFGGKAVEITIAATGTTGGQRMQFRVTQEAIRTELDRLGMSGDVFQRAGTMVARSNGLVMVSGRPGSGVTSTLYSMLRRHDAFVKQLVTLEAKAATDLENVTQNVYGDPGKLADALTAALRHDPDVVVVDRCDDSESAEVIRQGAARKLILLGMPAGDSFTALARWIKVCGDAARAMAILRGVLCQALVRKLCPACRQSYRPDRQLLAKANIPAGGVERFYRPPKPGRVDEKGKLIVCPTCQNTGYVGRTGVFELLEVTDEIRKLVADQAPLSRIKAACRKNNMQYLQEVALQKVIEGITGIQEVIRVTQPPKKPG